jgi:serine/threonine protein kinase
VAKVLENFGKYVLLEKLAAGGMAEVYLAKSTGASGINKFIAIKRILPQYSDHPEFIEMFKEEAKIAVNLNHGNVVSIYDFGVEKKQFFLVMEYVEGQNLRQILNHLKKENKYFSLDQIVYMAKEIAAGLDHAHRCLDGTTGKPLNITHRDMSPQNIMVSFEGEVKIVDFGIAKAESQMENTRAGTIKGKFGYMSPEQADGQTVDPRTDIFSMGILLWELFANDRLFTSNSEAATLRKIRECQIPSLRKLNPSVPPELERIVNKALTKDKTLRYQTAAAFHRDLNRFLNTQYPEFSPQDFSLFMKSAFSQMFIENRKKLIEFAKVRLTDDNEGTAVTATGTQTHTEEGDDSVLDEDEKSLKFDITDSVVPDLSDLKRRTPTKQPSFFGSNIRLEKLNQNSRSSIRRQPEPVNSSMMTSIGIGLFALFVIGAGGVYLWKRPAKVAGPETSVAVKQQPPSPPVAVANPDPVPAQPPPPANGGLIEAASQAQYYTVIIESFPSGARIAIDGQDTGMITPAQKSIEASKEFTLSLRKEGFQYYERKERAVQNGFQVKASLLPMPKMGYINLDLTNGGSNPVIFINGQRIEEKLPLKNYAVIAGSQVKIQAHNPFSGLAAEQIVTVGANQKIQINLILSPRRPSSSP